MASLHILLFDVGGTRCALRRNDVRELLPLPHLWRPPSLPKPLAGFFNLGGTAVSVVRMDVLFGLESQKAGTDNGLYRHLILVDGVTEGRPMAFLVDRVVDLALVDGRLVSPVREAGTLNGCVQGEIDIDGQLVHLLSVDRVLFAEEQQALSTLTQTAQSRLSEWTVSA
ncbi:chemotaxis protein CheW [Microvirga antarctica]|uniref:chemotaxis protein CheW n=1 Tax=Microvirga antarctica TaxID=2819233 RepID=UPI001B31012B|nr:chemotaxis protein CheW [Microvirga antarctica]